MEFGLHVFRHRARLLLGGMMGVLLCASSNAAIEVLGVQYQQDNPFSEYLCLWHDRNYPTGCSVDVVGANLHVYLKNTGSSSVTVSDVTLAGYSLKTVIKNQDFKDHHPYSIYYYWDDPPQDILDAGEPVWYKGDPSAIPAGQVGQAVIRLRSVPVTGTVNVGVVTAGGTVTTNIAINASAPQLASVGFSSDLKKVYLHWRRSGGAAPTTVKMDGLDVTASTTTVGDPSVNFAASVIQLPSPVLSMSYHVFQGVYADGQTATASLRAWLNPFIYGSWAAFPTDDYDLDAARAWIDTCQDRGINALIASMSSGGLADYLATPGGRQYAADHNYGFVIQNPGQWHCNNPLMWFIDDEPDVEEANLLNNSCNTGFNLPCGSNPTGILGLHFVQEGETLRAAYPMAPTTINLNGGYKPYGWQVYGQLADVLMIDSYYQKRLMGSLYYNPNRIPLYRKATVIYATSLAGTTAAEPNPFHMLLYSCEARPSGYPSFPFAPPETKRIEVYYALAGGAKGMGFWWFKPGGESNGLGDQSTAAAKALWREIGLLGNEIKTAQPLLVISHPVTTAIDVNDTNIWARTLEAGTNSLILIVVNENYMNDQAGCHITNVPNANVTVTLPSWLQSSPTAFEISAGGLNDVTTSLNEGQLQLILGTLSVTRMIVITTDPQLRGTIQQRYQQLVRPGVCSFAPEMCVTYPPSIVQEPTSQSVVSGGTVHFILLASGTSPLGYRWQKNQVNLTDGGHYSGCTTPTLTITRAGPSDEASYRCIITNDYGSANSSTVTLTLAVYNPCLSVSNADFEGGFTLAGGGYIATNWTEWETEAGVILGYDETGIVHGGAHAQRLRVSGGTNGSSGGVYQQVPVVAGQPFTASVWTYAGDPATACYLGVDSAGGTDPTSGVTWSTANTSAGWVQKTVTGTATASYVTVYLKVESTDSTKRNGYFDDAISAGCVDAPPGITQQPEDAAIVVGGTAYFGVVASGSEPFSYQWQKNEVNLSDGGHYTGSTTDVLTIGNADTNDAASYRCVVTNAFGSTNSMAATLTVTNAMIPPSITQQPSSQTLATGGTGNFTVGATGSEPLSYQWQKNTVNLSDGGHYAGVTTTTLTISSADSDDGASYRCVVTNAYGSTNSSVATLTVLTPNACLEVLNPGFEDGFVLAGGGYIATNWIEWETDAGVIVGYEETGIVHGGAHSQRIRVSGTGGTSGGVYQRLAVTAGNTYAVSVWIYADSELTSCYLGVDPAGGTNPDSGVVWSSATTDMAWVQKTWVGTATANYVTVFYKVATPDNVKRNGYFDDGTPAGGVLQLTAQRQGNVLNLLWPECPAAHLERADNLSLPMSWTAVTNQVDIIGGQRSVGLTPTGNTGYYRLVLE